MKEQQNMDFPDLEQYIREHWIPQENEKENTKSEECRKPAKERCKSNYCKTCPTVVQ